jgi:pyrroloquinoline quinone (PQQ) biosynthesis protein C
MTNPDGPRDGAHVEQAEAGLEQIHSRLRETTESMINNPVLEAVESGNLSQDEWREFAKQRYLAARHFEELLKAGIEKAQEIQDQELVEALSSNLRDEEGVNEHGQPLQTGSHEKWRQDFYNALGLDGHALSSAEPLDGTKEYDSTLRRLIDNEDVLTVAGALLIQEYSIPEEFKRIQVGRDLTFPAEFVTNSSDSSEQRRQKGFARLYIDHHIAHDARSHYPDLERAISKYSADPESLAKIMRGMEIISTAKQKFYESLQQIQGQK